MGAGRPMDFPIPRLLPRHHHKPAVAGVVIAGGQGQELVAVFCGDPGVIQGCSRYLLHILLEPLRAAQVGILVIPEHALGVDVVNLGVSRFLLSP